MNQDTLKPISGLTFGQRKALEPKAFSRSAKAE